MVVVLDAPVLTVDTIVVLVSSASSWDSGDTSAITLICSTILMKIEEEIMFEDWIASANDGVITAKQLIFNF